MPEAFVDAITPPGTVHDVASRVVRLAQKGITPVMIAPLAPDGNIERILHRFASDVMPQVQERIEA